MLVTTRTFLYKYILYENSRLIIIKGEHLITPYTPCYNECVCSFLYFYLLGHGDFLRSKEYLVN